MRLDWLPLRRVLPLDAQVCLRLVFSDDEERSISKSDKALDWDMSLRTKNIREDI